VGTAPGGRADHPGQRRARVSEACTSIIGTDGPRDPAPRPLIVQAWVAGDELRVRVSHRSRGVPTPGVGYGFGLALLARVCDRFEVRRRDDRPATALLMVFTLEGSPEPEPDPEPERSFPLRPSRSTTPR